MKINSVLSLQAFTYAEATAVDTLDASGTPRQRKTAGQEAHPSAQT